MSKVSSLKVLPTIAILLLAISPPVSAGVGQVLYERWASGGSADSMLTETSPPDYTEILTAAQWGVGDDNSIDNYRARITGWLIPPATGNYIFWLVTDDNGRLWLSTDDDPANARLIATESSWAGEGGWGGPGDEAQSVAIHLEAGKAYWMRGGYQEAGGGDHIRIAWASAEAGIAEHTIIDGRYLSDVPPITASSPSPADGAVDVPIEDVQLSWQAPAAIPGATYNLYFGTNANDLPVLGSDMTETGASAGTLEVGTTYSWKVDVIDPNDGNPVVIPGRIWTFTTAPETPVILVQPQSMMVFAGEEATFTIEAYSANSVPVTYKWFKEGAPANTLSETDTLTIPNVQAAEEGVYRCTVSNIFGQITSGAAELTLKKVIGHWPFDDNLNDIVGGNHGTTSPAPEFVPGIIGTSAVKFGPTSRAVIVSPQAYTGGSWSFSFWENATESLGAEWEILIAASETDSYEIIDFGREQLVQYYLGIYEDYPPTPAPTFARGQWHMLTLTYDADTQKVKLFVNSDQIIDFNKNFTGFGTNVSFGGDGANGYPYFGTIDDMKFYNYALSVEEIAWLYTQGSGERVCLRRPATDVSGPDGTPDCLVNIFDLVEMAGGWLQCNRIPSDGCY